MLNLSEYRIKKCYAEFREHEVQSHELRENNTDAHLFFDLKEGTWRTSAMSFFFLAVLHGTSESPALVNPKNIRKS